MLEMIIETLGFIILLAGLCRFCIYVGEKDKEVEKKIRKLNRKDWILSELTACEDDNNKRR